MAILIDRYDYAYPFHIVHDRLTVRVMSNDYT